MPYDIQLAERVRSFLTNIPSISVEEKKMFRGLAFMVNEKMCVNVSDDNLMCRFDPSLTDELAVKPGYKPMIMKGKELKGYCYVAPEGIKTKKDFEFWLNLSLRFNKDAKASRKQNKK